MGKQEALHAAKFVVMPGRLPQGRAPELINDPEKLQQGPWGICGMAAVGYALLCHKPERFVELVKEAVWGQSEKYRTRLFRLYDAKREYSAVNMLDFFVSRFMGILMEDTAPALFTQEKQFTVTLGQQMNGASPDGIMLSQGDLALDKEGILWMVNHVAAATHVQVLESGPLGAGEIAMSAANIRAQMAGAGRFTIAAQMEHDAPKPYRFNHWVVIESITELPAGGRFDVDFWSRGSKVAAHYGFTLAELQESFPFLITGTIA
jgi:hypothetical protein